MIYDFPDPQAPIRQGDIFQQIPRVDLDPARLLVMSDSPRREAEMVDWLKIATRMARTPALVSIRPVFAIVMTQDCDAGRVEDISLC